MRPVLHGDVSNAARALLHVPEPVRREMCKRMIQEAEAADIFARREGRLHPWWGNGSLMSAARKRALADEPGFDNPDYCRCFEMVLQGLIRHWSERTRS